MDLLKALKRTTILSAATAVAVFALGATESEANDTTTTITAHMSMSIATALVIAEVSPMNFGNIAPPTAGVGKLILAADGTLTASGHLVPLDGATGLTSASGNKETAGQAPGFFSITTDSETQVYVSFANISGAIIDPSHPANSIPLFGPDSGVTATDFTVDTFTVSSETYTVGPPATGTGYDGSLVVSTATTGGGYYPVTVAGGATATRIRVGATLHDSAGTTVAPGRYAATYYVMVSY